LQVLQGDLIGASRGAADAILRSHGHSTVWQEAALLTLDVYWRVLMLLDAARRMMPDVDSPLVDAGWKRCGEARLPQHLVEVRIVLSVRDSSKQYFAYEARSALRGRPHHQLRGVHGQSTQEVQPNCSQSEKRSWLGYAYRSMAMTSW